MGRWFVRVVYDTAATHQQAQALCQAGGLGGSTLIDAHNHRTEVRLMLRAVDARQANSRALAALAIAARASGFPGVVVETEVLDEVEHDAELSAFLSPES